MLPETRQARSLAAGLGLLILATGSVFALRSLRPPYAPSAPDYRQKGPQLAPVTVAVYSDFQCPACRAAVEPMKTLEDMFPGRIRSVFKHLPWPFHPHAKNAALAAECAGRRGRFWDYHDKLYARQELWSRGDKTEELFLRYAGELGLNASEFRACLKDPRAAAAVEADFKEAKEHWVNSTPTFFINGRRFVGALQLRTYGFNHIERLMKDAGA